MANFSTEQETAYAKQTGNEINNATRMAWFQAFRGEFGYSNFGEYRTSVTADIQFVIIIYTCVLISVATLIVAAGIRGKERWYTLIRVIYSLAVGTIILGDFMDSRNRFKYNEEYDLEKVLKSPEQMSEALSRGLPAPLLFIIEHYDTDAGDFRFGRGCFMAGYFANILLWASFISWVTGTILLCSVIWYGAALYIVTGVCMLLAAIIYDILCTRHEIKLPYTEGFLTLSYGWCFWSTLVFGILNTLIGIIVFAMENKAPKWTALFFQLETPLEDNDDIKIFMSPPSRLPTVPNTPVPSIRVDKDSKLNPRMNWYVNYGYDSSKANPVFNTEHGNDVTKNPTINGRDVSKMGDRTSSLAKIRPITEEDNKASTGERVPTDSQNDNEVNDKDEATINRLNEIYVDVEPTHRKDSIVNHMFIQELDAAIEGK